LEIECAEQALWYKPILRVSNNAYEAVAAVAKEEEVDVVVAGVERDAPLGLEWRRTATGVEVHQLRHHLGDIPALDAHATPITADLVAELEESIARRRKAMPGAPAPPVVEVSQPEPTTSPVPRPVAEGLPSKADGEDEP
jgi:hypothetical protein